MAFSILCYLDNLEDVTEHNSWIQAKCPACGGHLLKINRATQAFGCYSNFCHDNNPNLIIKELTKHEFKPKRSSYPRQIRIAPLVDIVKPLPLDFSNIANEQFYTDRTYKAPWSTTLDNGSKFTIYEYDDFQLVRISPLAEKKFFYFRIKNEQKEWVNQVPSTFKNVPVYRSEYLAECVIFTEGEKCAASLQSLGLFAISFPSFVYEQSYLAKFLRCLSYKIKNAIYLEDNDDVGRQKAEKFLKEAWKSKINASSYNIAKLLGKDAEKNYDVDDAIDEWEIVSREELLGVLRQCSTQNRSV